MKKADIILIVSGIIISGLFIFLLLNQSRGGVAEVVIDGKMYRTINLSVDDTITIQNNDYINVIEIKNGKVFMKEANCPNGDCIKMGEIYRNNQAIVCLPHKLSITVKGSDSEFDYIVE